MRRCYFFVFNPIAGTSKRSSVERVAATLGGRGHAIAWAKAATAVDAQAEIRTAVQSGAFDCIVAAGGDGTIRQAAIAVSGSQVPLGVVPLGTGNVLAHELGLPRDTRGIADYLEAAHPVPVELGLANDQPFLLMAGVGFDGRVIAELNHAWKNRYAKLAYVPPTLSALRAPLDHLEVTIDGTRHDATWAIIAKSECYGGAFRLARGARITNPSFVAVLVNARSKGALIAQLLALARGTFAERSSAADGVQQIACTTAHISAPTSVPCQLDGDVFVGTPIMITRGGGTIKLLVPRTFIP